MSDDVSVAEGTQPQSPATPEESSSKRPNWFLLAGRTIANPFKSLYRKDEGVHVRLMTFLTIALLIVAIASIYLVPLIGKSISPEPVVAASASPPKSPITTTKPQPCSADATNGIQSCALGRTSGVWSKSVKVDTTGIVTVELYYANRSRSQQMNVVVRVEVPDNLKYLDGTTFLHTSDGTQSVKDGIARGGAIIGGFLPSGDAYLKFSVVAADTSSLACGENVRVINYITVTSGGNRNAALPVTIAKIC